MVIEAGRYGNGNIYDYQESLKLRTLFELSQIFTQILLHLNVLKRPNKMLLESVLKRNEKRHQSNIRLLLMMCEYIFFNTLN